MNRDERIAFAQAVYAAGVCPGCGHPLEDVAGAGVAHGLNGVVWAGYGIGPDRCPWSPDELAAIVHVGAGFLASLRGPAMVGSSGPADARPLLSGSAARPGLARPRTPNGAVT